MDARHRGHSKQYLVRWVGYDWDHNEWLLGKMLEDTEALDIWEAENGIDVWLVRRIEFFLAGRGVRMPSAPYYKLRPHTTRTMMALINHAFKCGRSTLRQYFYLLQRAITERGMYKSCLIFFICIQIQYNSQAVTAFGSFVKKFNRARGKRRWGQRTRRYIRKTTHYLNTLNFTWFVLTTCIYWKLWYSQ